MNSLEIIRLFNEEGKLKQFVLNVIDECAEDISIQYIIYTDKHEPLTPEQQAIYKEYGNCEGEIHLSVDVNVKELLGYSVEEFIRQKRWNKLSRDAKAIIEWAFTRKRETLEVQVDIKFKDKILVTKRLFTEICKFVIGDTNFETILYDADAKRLVFKLKENAII